MTPYPTDVPVIERSVFGHLTDDTPIEVVTLRLGERYVATTIYHFGIVRDLH